MAQLLVAVGLLLPLPFVHAAPAASARNAVVTVDGVGTFQNYQEFTFTGSDLPAGLSPSSYTVDDAKYLAHHFSPSNVAVSGGYVQLKVPGGQSTSPVQSAEITTDVSNILYASVRTTAILGDPAGTCNGMFFYQSDTQELDIEFLSDANSQSNPGDGTRLMFYTNQAVDGVKADESAATGPVPSDATTAEHEYRIDWLPGSVTYYLDGVVQATFTNNIPSQGGQWVWNNWSSGDPGFTVGPPATDNILKISKVVMYYNTTA